MLSEAKKESSTILKNGKNLDLNRIEVIKLSDEETKKLEDSGVIIEETILEEQEINITKTGKQH